MFYLCLLLMFLNLQIICLEFTCKIVVLIDNFIPLLEKLKDTNANGIFIKAQTFLFKTEHLHCDVEKEKHTCYCCTPMFKTCLYKWYCTTILGEKATKANWNSQWWSAVMDRVTEEENISVKYNWNWATAKWLEVKYEKK